MNRGRRLSEMDHLGSHIHVSSGCLQQPRAVEQSLIDYLVGHSGAAGPRRVEVIEEGPENITEER